MKKILAFFLILIFTGCGCFNYGLIDRFGRICGQDPPQKIWKDGKEVKEIL